MVVIVRLGTYGRVDEYCISIDTPPLPHITVQNTGNPLIIVLM
jgi:hypothetical protein